MPENKIKDNYIEHKDIKNYIRIATNFSRK